MIRLIPDTTERLVILEGWGERRTLLEHLVYVSQDYTVEVPVLAHGEELTEAGG